MTDQYAQPATPYQPTQPKTSGMAVTSLVFGILSFCMWIFASIPALILGFIALGKINKSQGQVGGKGIAIAGLVTGGSEQSWASR
jgi:hypothetical protein